MPLCLNLDQNLSGLQSWVPDWTVRSKVPVVYSATRFSCSSTYDAANMLDGNVKVGSDYTLAINGIDFGTITEIACHHKLTALFLDQLEIFHAWEEFLGLVEHSDDSYVGGGRLGDDFWRTMQ